MSVLATLLSVDDNWSVLGHALIVCSRQLNSLVKLYFKMTEQMGPINRVCNNYFFSINFFPGEILKVFRIDHRTLYIYIKRANYIYTLV